MTGLASTELHAPDLETARAVRPRLARRLDGHARGDRVSLAGVATVLGPELAGLYHGAAPERDVTGLVVLEAGEAPELATGALVVCPGFDVGAHTHRAWLERCSAAGAAGAVVRADLYEPAAVDRLATATELPILVVTTALRWHVLLALLQTLIASGAVGDACTQRTARELLARQLLRDPACAALLAQRCGLAATELSIAACRGADAADGIVGESGIAVTLDDTVYAVGTADAVEAWWDRLPSGTTVVKVMGARVAGPEDLAGARADVDAVLDLIAAGRIGGTAAHVADLEPTLMLQRLAREVRPRPSYSSIARLRERDRRDGSAYLATVAAYLDAFGDVGAASRRCGVHPNTFRYRLARAVAHSGLRLDDPDERLLITLDLRLEQLQPGAR